MYRQNRLTRPFHLLVIVLASITLISGCVHSRKGGYLAGDNAPNIRVNHESIPNAVPRVEPYTQLGNPESYTVYNKTYYPLKSSQGFVESGVASWYGTKFHGRRTSSGETYNIYGMTAAHKTLPLPTYVEVTNLDNGKSIIVKVNDRGPFHDNRIIDLSYVAALKLDVVKTGTARVEIRAIDPRNPTAHRQTTPTTLPEADQPMVIALEEPDTIPTTVIAEPITQANSQPQTKPIEATKPFYLQIGAFSSFINADSLRSRLLPVAGNQVSISKTIGSSQPVYRVRIGPLKYEQELEKLSLKLAAEGITNTRVVFD